jgi:polyhydroxybutyrate depolymerase
MKQPGTQTVSLPGGPFERRYLAHVPPGQGPWPVVLMLHGAGAAPRWTLEETGWHLTADREGFLVAVPEGLPVDPTRPASFKHNPPFWNDGSPRARSAPRQVDDVAFLVAVLDDLGRRFPAADLSRVGVTGFSNGAGMTFRLATEMSPRLAAIAPVAGHCWLDDPRPSRPLPTLYLVGTEDPLVPLAGGTVSTPWGWAEERPPVRETLRRWSRALGADGPHELGKEDGIEHVRYGGAGVDFLAYTIEGLGHHWPGGRGLLSRRLFGPPSRRVEATGLVWDFFRRHALG